MSEFEQSGIFEPLAGPATANHQALEPNEHTISLQVAQALQTLDVFEKHMNPSYGNTLPADEARRIRVSVEETYNNHILPNEDDDGFYDHHPDYEHPYEREIRAIEGTLRDIWHQKYYEPRSHPTSKDEFQYWLDSYIDRYGAATVGKITHSDRPFQSRYRPFERAHGNDRDLRTAESNLLLIQGCGSMAISTLEAPETTIQLAIPGVWHHNDIFTLQTSPEQWFGSIDVPSDVIAKAVSTVH